MGVDCMVFTHLTATATDDHSRHIPAVRSRILRRYFGGPRRQVHDAKFTSDSSTLLLRAWARDRLRLPKEHQYPGGAGQWRHQPYTTRLRPGHSPSARRVRNHQSGLVARRRIDCCLHATRSGSRLRPRRRIARQSSTQFQAGDQVLLAVCCGLTPSTSLFAAEVGRFFDRD